MAFHGAWQHLLEADHALASSAYADATREALAMHIIDLAQRGQHDVNKLRDDGVAFILAALQRKQA